jgi:hypothetical protein
MSTVPALCLLVVEEEEKTEETNMGGEQPLVADRDPGDKNTVSALQDAR